MELPSGRESDASVNTASVGVLSRLRAFRTKGSGCLMDSEVCMCVCGEGGDEVVLMKEGQSDRVRVGRMSSRILP